MTWTKRIMQIFLCLLAIPIGLEIALHIWIQWKNSRVNNVNLTGQPTVIAIGDSVTEHGYAKELPRYWEQINEVQNLAISGRGLTLAVELIEQNYQNWKGQPYKIIVMAGHNDCRYLRKFAALHSKPTEPSTTFLVKQWLWKTKTMELLSEVLHYQQKSSIEPYTPSIPTPPNSLQGSQDTDFCLVSLQEGLKNIAQYKDDLDLFIMTYPIPTTEKSIATDPDRETFASNFASVNMLVNSEIRNAAWQYEIPLIDGEECMKDAPRDYWKEDGLHLEFKGGRLHAKCVLEALGFQDTK